LRRTWNDSEVFAFLSNVNRLNFLTMCI
jgi:hypothetical protein